jgi:hypothetical protein
MEFYFDAFVLSFLYSYVEQLIVIIIKVLKLYNVLIIKFTKNDIDSK